MRANQILDCCNGNANVMIPTRSGDLSKFKVQFKAYAELLPKAAKFFFHGDQPPEIDPEHMIPECITLPDVMTYFESESNEGNGDMVNWALCAIEVPEDMRGKFPNNNLRNSAEVVTPHWIANLFVKRGRKGDWILFSPQGVVGVTNTGRVAYTFYPTSGSDIDATTDIYTSQVEAMKLAIKQVIYFLHMLACKNISTTKVVPATGKQNEKRKKSGQTPLYSYHVIKLPSKYESVEGDGHAEVMGLTRESPRLHFRRGHVRHLSSGQLTWVTNCMVGDEKRGIVEKHYEHRGNQPA